MKTLFYFSLGLGLLIIALAGFVFPSFEKQDYNFYVAVYEGKKVVKVFECWTYVQRFDEIIFYDTEKEICREPAAKVAVWQKEE